MTTTIPTERAALILQMDAGYTPTTTDPARACASCRWYSELPGTSQCHLVVNSPESINAGGGCNRHEPMPEGSVVISYMEDYGVENPNNGNIPARVLADSIMYSGEALENLNGYLASTEQLSAEDGSTRSAPGAVTYRFVNHPVALSDTVEGVIDGYVYIFGNPDRVNFIPGVLVGWGEGEQAQVGRVSAPPAGDMLTVEVCRKSGFEWAGTGKAVELDKLSVRAIDQYGTWFDASNPPQLDIDNGAHVRPIKYEHCDDPQIGMETVGYIDSVGLNDIGLRFVASLDRSSPHFARVADEVQRGLLKTSSATLNHTARFRADGSFNSWTLGELSLTRYPAESRMPSTTLIRSASQEEARVEPRAGDEPHVEIEIELPSEAPELEGEKTMTPEQLAMLQQLVAEFGIDAVEAAIEQANAPVPAEAAPVPEAAMSAAPAAVPAPGRSLSIDALRSALVANKQTSALEARLAALESARNAAPAQQPIVRGAQRPGEGVNVNWIPDSKTSNLSPSDMWFAQQALGANGKVVSDAFTRSMFAKSVDAFQNPAKNGDEFAQGFLRSFGNKRANEIMATDISGQGTEWVGVAYATDLWEKIRISPVYDAFRSLGMMEMSLGQGQNSIYVPTEGADPTWTSAPEANDISSGRIEVTANPQFVGTGRVQVTPGTLKATVAWSEELDEDSLIPMASWLNTQMARSAAEVAEYVLINGDTVITATTNMNLIDGTPGTGASRPAYLATNGILKLPIITTTSLSYDAGNTHSEETYLEVLKKLPNEVNGDVNNVVFIIGVREHFAALNVTAFKTRDVNSQAAVEDGVISRIFGRKVLMSGQIALANSAGKISATPGNNIYGRIIAAVPRYWAVVNKRDVRFKLSEDPYQDAQLLRVSFRMGATYRSTTSAAATAYEVAV